MLFFYFFAAKKPVGQSVPRSTMIQTIKNLKINLINLGNDEADRKLQSEISWNDDYESRIKVLSDVIAFTSEKYAGKGNFAVIYKNYRMLDFWKQLYENENEDFDKEFKLAMSKINDQTKTNVRYNRWSRIFKMLPKGSYASCAVPNSYWRLIKKKQFDEIISSWGSN